MLTCSNSTSKRFEPATNAWICTWSQWTVCNYNVFLIYIRYPEPSSSTPIWLDDLDCSGFESFLQSCDSNGYGNHNCAHNEDVALTCLGSASASRKFLP